MAGSATWLLPAPEPRFARELPTILPLPFRLAALSRRRSGRGEGWGEGSVFAWGFRGAMADEGGSSFPAWWPPLPTPLLQRRRGRSSRRLVAVSRDPRGIRARLFLISHDIQLGNAGEGVAVYLGPCHHLQVAGLDRLLEGYGLELVSV